MGGRADEKAGTEELLETSPFAGDLEEELAAGPRHRPSTLTLVLGAGVTLVVGVILGIQAQKAMGDQGGTSGAPAAMRQGMAGPGGYGGGPGGPGGPGGYGGFGGRQQGGQGNQGNQGGQGNAGGMGGVTFGTVQRVEGGKVYLQRSDGTVVTVNTTGRTTVRVSREGKVTDLRSGGTVVVQGTGGEDGSITATTISEGGGRR
ncbi:hypothetical protein [Streptosporangium carneum]|uniref:DUF5666 domain-containing protein n=1 Tax=Streptosporangium carneum TaxID=47481 RepID=A0A9W6MEW2_9ACTN|nr:hypothetical protein [Streptosporangium carneum]GLK11233.1 hypothetical protein GCM10017600_46390 [Streptosporangium carneum]